MLYVCSASDISFTKIRYVLFGPVPVSHSEFPGACPLGCQETTEEGSGVKTESEVAEEDHTEAEMQNEQAMEGMSMAPDSLQRM